ETGAAGVVVSVAELSKIKSPHREQNERDKHLGDMDGAEEENVRPKAANRQSVNGPSGLKDSNPTLLTPGNPTVSPFSPQTTGLSFTGATLSDTGAFPPDSMGDVGPTQYIVAVNGRIRSFNKTTGVADAALNLDTDVFFSSVMSSNPGTFTSDPRIRYDRA